MSFDVASLVAQQAGTGLRDRRTGTDWGDVTDVTDPDWPLVDGVPARNVTGRPLSVGDPVRLMTSGRDRLIVGIDTIQTPGPGPEPAGGGWELIWQAQAAGNIFDPDVAQFDDWDSLRMVVLIRGSASGSMGQALVELSGFGGMTPPTVSLADGEEASVTMEADRHMDGGWSARIHDIAPPGSVSGRAAATTIGAWQNFPSATITPVIFPSGGAGYVSARLYGLPHTEEVG